MKHLQFCIDEMMAEVAANLTCDQHVRALAQLDEREARGETLTVVDPKALRAALQVEIAFNPLTRANRKLEELRSIIATAASPIPGGRLVSTAIEPLALSHTSAPDTWRNMMPLKLRGRSPTPTPRNGVTGGAPRWPQAAAIAAVLALIAVSVHVQTSIKTWQPQEQVTDLSARAIAAHFPDRID